MGIFACAPRRRETIWSAEGTGFMVVVILYNSTVCPGSSDPPEKIFSIFASVK